LAKFRWELSFFKKNQKNRQIEAGVSSKLPVMLKITLSFGEIHATI
jgi:hypothetical protein